jgi:uncharacterized protein DUF2510
MGAPMRAGWYPDPSGNGGMRYFDGYRWTDHVSARRLAAPFPMVLAPLDVRCRSGRGSRRSLLLCRLSSDSS